jgi:hypothetical protein
MTPRLTPLIPIDLDKRRHLRLELTDVFLAEYDMCQFWHRQVNILDLFTSENRLTLNDLAILVRRGLLHEDPTLTLAQVQQMMTFDRYEQLLPAFFEAWNAATQSAVPPEKDSDTAGPPSFHGANSGATPVLS